MSKNKTKAFLLFPLLAIFLTACTLGDLPVIGKYFVGTPTGPVTLNVWGLWEDPAVIDVLITKYQEQNPTVTVNYEDRSIMSLVDYKERVFSRASDESSQIDVFTVHNSWVSKLSSLLAPMPANIMTPEEYSSVFYPVSTKSAVINGSIYASPLYYDGLALVYNKKHFEEIGQRFPPTAWEEFRRLATELTVRGGTDGTEIVRAGAAIGTHNNVSHFSDILGLMWSQAGVSIPDGVDSKPAYDALTYYTNFVKEDTVWNASMPQDTVAFASGKVSMIFVPTWQLLDLVSTMPNIEDIGVAQVPQALPDTPSTWASFWMYSVPKNSQNVNVAWDFINFMTSEESQLTQFDESSKVRVLGAPYSRVALSELVTNQFLSPVLDTASFAQSAEIAGRSGNRKQVNALSTAVDAVLSGASSEEALKTAKSSL